MEKVKYIGDSTPEVHIKKNEKYTGCGKDMSANKDMWKSVPSTEKVTCQKNGCKFDFY